jgi:hypothetical protein
VRDGAPPLIRGLQPRAVSMWTVAPIRARLGSDFLLMLEPPADTTVEQNRDGFELVA